MVDRSCYKGVLLITDRGLEGYNLMAHIQEKEWMYLILVKNSVCSGRITAGLMLRDTDAFDMFISLTLTIKASKNGSKIQPFFMTLRIVQFKIPENNYESVVTNLGTQTVLPQKLRKLYNMRWGIVTSLRDLKYTVGLLTPSLIVAPLSRGDTQSWLILP